MRFKVDENLPIEVAELLRQHQHDALTVLDQQLGGHPDPDVAQVCLVERRALVTLDLDFSDIRHYPRRTTLESSCYGPPSRRSRPCSK
jgi:predicted nuclease of predicted toxin-antitoxin system